MIYLIQHIYMQLRVANNALFSRNSKGYIFAKAKQVTF